MSLGQGFVYVQFHPLVYLLKLHIELNMAELITKVVRTEGSSYPSGSGNKSSFARTDTQGVKLTTLITTGQHHHNLPGDDDLENAQPQAGIQRTIETKITHSKQQDDDAASWSSSTAELRKQHGIV
jgi:hypothetical protein